MSLPNLKSFAKPPRLAGGQTDADIEEASIFR